MALRCRMSSRYAGVRPWAWTWTLRAHGGTKRGPGMQSGGGCLYLHATTRPRVDTKPLLAAPQARLSSTSASPPLQSQLKSAFRAFPSPLTLLSAHPPGQPAHGMLVSSLATVTLHPTPFVSFNVRLPSRCWDAITAAEGACVLSALTDAQAARWWAGVGAGSAMEGNEAGKDDGQRYEGTEGEGSGDGESDGHGSTDEKGNTVQHMLSAPLRQGRRWALQCRVRSELCMRVDDHVVVVAEVSAVEHGAGAHGVLVWRDGDARRVASRPASSSEESEGERF